MIDWHNTTEEEHLFFKIHDNKKYEILGDFSFFLSSR